MTGVKNGLLTQPVGQKNYLEAAPRLPGRSRILPRCLSLDKPFAALDAITRSRMQALLVRLQAQTGVTVLMVTHDVAEACLLADTVRLMGTAAGIVEAWGVEAPRPRNADDPELAPFRAQLREKLQTTIVGF